MVTTTDFQLLLSVRSGSFVMMTTREFEEHFATIRWAERMMIAAIDEKWRRCWQDIADKHREYISCFELRDVSEIEKQ